MNSREPRIYVYPVSPGSNRHIAVFASNVLGATYSVVFSATITGAVALHTFAEMIRKQYGRAAEIVVSERLSLPEDSPVKDILRKINTPLFTHRKP